MQRMFRRTDTMLFAVVGVVTLLVGVLIVEWSAPPFEDAAILMRYASHFANGFGIVWNPGEHPVDGATDFLFMVAVGMLVKSGVQLEFATRLLSLTAHIVTLGLVYWTVRKTSGGGSVAAFASSLFLAIGPGLYYVVIYFGTPFFALFAALAWYHILAIAQYGESRSRSLAFGFSALIASLVRPEGVILTGLMLASLVVLRGPMASRRPIAYYFLIFAVLGGGYFAWRWQYFGFPLPNPFYKKGGGHLYPASLAVSFRNVMGLAMPFLPVLLAGVFWGSTMRRSIAFLLPVVGFAAAFLLLSNEMNVRARFQYPVLPLVLMSWPAVFGEVKRHLHIPPFDTLSWRKKLGGGVLVAAVLSGLVAYQMLVAPPRAYTHDGRYDVSMILRELRDKNYTLATSEAGLLPLYSGWRTLDAWGLNDQRIAHHGMLTEEYLAEWAPQVIVFHAWYSPRMASDGKEGAWLDMTTTLQRFAERRGYILAAAFGQTAAETHYYYIRPDFPESRDIVRRIRGMEYIWYQSGTRATDFALPGTNG